MDLKPNHLKKDELQHELQIRGVDPGDFNVQDLRSMFSSLQRLLKEASVVIEDENNELLVIHTKLIEIQDVISSGTDSLKESKISTLKTRVLHYLYRSQRISADAKLTIAPSSDGANAQSSSSETPLVTHELQHELQIRGVDPGDFNVQDLRSMFSSLQRLQKEASVVIKDENNELLVIHTKLIEIQDVISSGTDSLKESKISTLKTRVLHYLYRSQRISADAKLTIAPSSDGANAQSSSSETPLVTHELQHELQIRGVDPGDFNVQDLRSMFSSLQRLQKEASVVIEDENNELLVIHTKLIEIQDVISSGTDSLKESKISTLKTRVLQLLSNSTIRSFSLNDRLQALNLMLRFMTRF
ncbi:hypothetical protein FQR65_LT17320 [Abscondita terminalis]|nr:hypothetical protein FQR65_LT17320 [Abscondita terminalis]